MQTVTQRLANPTRFMELSGKLLPWLSGVAALPRLRAVPRLLRRAPDYQQGETAASCSSTCRAAWLAMVVLRPDRHLGFGLLVFRHPLADVSAKAAVPSAPPSPAGAGHRLAVGPAHVGHLLGVGRAPDVRADPVLPLPRPDGPALLARGRAAGRQAHGDPGAGRRRDPADHQVLGRLVGTRCTSRRAFRDGGPTIHPSSSRRCWSWRWASRCCSSPCI